ncbi:DNA-binding regulatory protein, YebC/PmpR family [Oesophagostomum dentatum]|uniref:DNA-binding regulatory protein, YebC/PmpR family n=1 Tax=Oesophagostomum dentatum TaxID=61180 RepID=A0A0B1TDQ3_OESDE|nr:DNA-binding regulatory protein, YebC/PmpR family [Oesophagostomum dentatum]
MLPSPRFLFRRGFSVSSSLFKGHSKWQNIKATKGKNDMIKSQAMNTLLKKAKAAALRGGYDLKLNRELSALEQDCRSQGLSLDTFRNFLIKMKVGGFRFASEASAVQSWFQRKGVLTVKADLKGKQVPLEQMEEIGIELDCEDVALVEAELFELLCSPDRLSEVESNLTNKGFTVESAELQYRPLHPVRIDGDDASKVEKLYELLQEDESIRQIFDNIQPGP